MKTALLTLLVLAANVFAAQPSDPVPDESSSEAAGEVTSEEPKRIWFYPMTNSENYYSPQEGRDNLVLYKKGQNYYYRDDDGVVIWLYPRGDRYYSPRGSDKLVWCYPSGKNFYCEERERRQTE